MSSPFFVRGIDKRNAILTYYFVSIRISRLFGEKSILLFVPQKVFLGGVVGPDFLDGFVDITLVFDFFEILNHFEWSARASGVVDEFFLGGWPRGIFEF